jgi:hypothetical protein
MTLDTILETVPNPQGRDSLGNRPQLGGTTLYKRVMNVRLENRFSNHSRRKVRPGAGGSCYSGGRDQEHHGSNPTPGKQFVRTYF